MTVRWWHYTVQVTNGDRSHYRVFNTCMLTIVITRSSLISEFKGMSMTQVTFHMLTFQMSLNTTSQYGFPFWALQMAHDLGGAGHLIWPRSDHETTYVSFSRWLSSSSRQPALTSGYLDLTTSRSSMGKTNCSHGQLLYVFGPVTWAAQTQLRSYRNRAKEPTWAAQRIYTGTASRWFSRVWVQWTCNPRVVRTQEK